MTPRDVKLTPKPFALPSELVGSRPRDVRLTAAGRIVNGLAIALIAGAIAVAILLSRVSAEQSRAREAFTRDAVTVTAEVTRLWRDSDEEKHRWVAYRFEASGAAFSGRSRMGSSQWRALQVGSPIDVRYLPADPAHPVLAGREPDVLPPIVPFLVAALMVSAALLMLRGLNSQRQLLAEGRPAAAAITDIVKHQSSHGSHRSIKYTFTLLSGATATGKSDGQQKPDVVGTMFCVVYDPDRPKRSRRYPFPLVKTSRL